MAEQTELIRMLLRLLFTFIVLGGILFVVRFTLKRSGRIGAVGKGRNLVQVISTDYIGVKKSITMVKIPDAILVLGVTNEQITLLSKIEDQALINQICANDTQEGASKLISRQLHKLSSGITGSGNEKKINSK
jgi:flagellar biogenesis protein FliO